MSQQALAFDADTRPDGYISGIASTPSTDSYGHKVLRGAFDASIARRGLNGSSGVKLLNSHEGLPIGRINSLRTVGADLRIEAELNLDLQSVRDLHSTILHTGGLSFSVGFTLEDHEVLDKPDRDGAWLLIKSGDLVEVSIVCFPANSSATMSLVKSETPGPAMLASIQAQIANIKRILAHG